MSDPIPAPDSSAPALPQAELSIPSGPPESHPLSPRLSKLMAALTPAQVKVMSGLAQGLSICQAAGSARVCRMTVYRWIKRHPHFKAAYNCWREELLESAQTKLVYLLDEAVDTIRDVIIGGNSEMAWKLARAMGAFRRPKRGSIDPAKIDDTGRPTGDDPARAATDAKECAE